jgi:hypothetical protein
LTGAYAPNKGATAHARGRSTEWHIVVRRRRVLNQTDVASYGGGIVTSHDERTDIVVVMDLDDGSYWPGPEDWIEICPRSKKLMTTPVEFGSIVATIAGARAYVES